nr:type I-U CRISPR-associated RAMP protein Csb1/Cas7u [Corynebacterium provencense]
MAMITLTDLLTASQRGGSSTLTSVTELRPAAGPHASVAPAKFVNRSGSTFAFETRYIDGEAVNVALLDSKQSQLNRAESALSLAVRDGEETAAKIPHITVDYGEKDYTDLELPHRAFDGHVRAASLDGVPVPQTEQFQALRNCTPANARPLLETSPFSLVGGVWDSTRRADQVRFRSALVGEIIGVLADQQAAGDNLSSLRGGARVDPVAMSVQLSGPDLEKILDAQQDELSSKLVEKIRKEIKGLKKGERISASNLGLGGIPPQLDALGGVACSRIIRSWVLSFAALRQIRFGAGAEGDVACRALLAALALNSIARAEQELYLRANCDLVEAAAPVVTLDERFGSSRELEPLTVDAADALLEEAMELAARKAGVVWSGQDMRVTGDPAIIRGAVDESEDEA